MNGGAVSRGGRQEHARRSPAQSEGSVKGALREVPQNATKCWRGLKGKVAGASAWQSTERSVGRVQRVSEAWPCHNHLPMQPVHPGKSADSQPMHRQISQFTAQRTAQLGTLTHCPNPQPSSPLRPCAMRRCNVHHHQAHQTPNAGANEQHGHKHARGDGAAGCIGRRRTHGWQLWAACKGKQLFGCALHSKFSTTGILPSSRLQHASAPVQAAPKK